MSLLAAAIRGFTYHGDDAPALRDVDLTLRSGTLTAVLGGSGSGKTTLGKILAGWLRAGAAGSLRGGLALGGERLEFSGGDGDPRIDPAAWSGRVGYVPQDAATMLSTVRHTVAEELAFGLENRGVPRPEMLRRVALTAERTGLGGLLERNPERLSGGELRRLAVACAVIGEPEVLILDEPLASLDPAGAQGIARLVDDLRAAGTAVVVLGQAADGLARSAAHWLVLADGTAVVAGEPRDIPEQLLRDAGVLAGDAAGGVRHPAPVDPAAAPVLELRDAGFGYAPGGAGPARSGPLLSRLRPARLRRERADDADIPPLLRGLDLAVRPGEIVAVTGPNGAGKSTLLRLANGLLQPRHGEVRVLGAPIAGVPAGRVADSVSLLFQQPRDQLFERTVLREVGFGLRRLAGPDGDAPARALAALTAVGLAGAAAAHPAELPSSRQRLLALATVMARRPALLALDEPTVGLDRHGLVRLHAAVADAAGRGAGVLLVTHDAAYARAAAHRVLELDGGKLRETWRRPAP